MLKIDKKIFFIASLKIINDNAFSEACLDRRISSFQHSRGSRYECILHALSAIRNGCKRIIIRASDTDIVVISLYLFEHFAIEGLEELFIQSKVYFIPIPDVEKVLSQNENTMLLLLHALSGCDTTSFIFYGEQGLFKRC